MKKVLLALSFVTLVAFSTTSCKKEYTCTCTDSNGQTTSTKLPKAKKSDAETACNVYEVSGSSCKIE